jgi:UPF0716 protein FxsA
MLSKLFLAFAVIPIVELYLLVKIGSVIGAFSTIVLVLASAFVGAWLAREQGIQTMYRVQSSLAQGIMPTDEIINGVIIFSPISFSLLSNDCNKYIAYIY